jgi:hypothetical protein
MTGHSERFEVDTQTSRATHRVARVSCIVVPEVPLTVEDESRRLSVILSSLISTISRSVLEAGVHRLVAPLRDAHVGVGHQRRPGAYFLAHGWRARCDCDGCSEAVEEALSAST